MSSGNGFPPWRFALATTPKEHFQQGVSIGDVGHVDQMGGFVYWFNIFYPRDHPIQEGNVPRKFHPIEPQLSEWKIQRSTNQYEPGSVISSEGISSSRISDHPL
jgi:hypothetical protein